MIVRTFPSEPTEEQIQESLELASCKCSRCTRTGEQSDSKSASEDLGST